MAPPAPTAASARSAFAASPDAMVTRTLVSKKLAGIRLVSVEFESGRKTAAEGAKTPQELVTPRLTRDTELPGVGDMDFNLIAFPKLKRFDHGGGKADRETISPLSDLHVSLPVGYTLNQMYI